MQTPVTAPIKTRSSLFSGPRWLSEHAQWTAWTTPSILEHVLRFLPLFDLVRVRLLNTDICRVADLLISRLLSYRKWIFCMPAQQLMHNGVQPDRRRRGVGRPFTPPFEVPEREVVEERTDLMPLLAAGDAALFYRELLQHAFIDLWEWPLPEFRVGLTQHPCLSLRHAREFVKSRFYILESLKIVLGHARGGLPAEDAIFLQVIAQRVPESALWERIALLSGYILTPVLSPAFNDEFPTARAALPNLSVARKLLARLPSAFYAYVAKFQTYKLIPVDSEFALYGPSLALLFNWLRCLIEMGKATNDNRK